MTVFTCPKCGADLIDICLTTWPSIPTKRCMRCGWYWEGKPEDVKRVPFEPPKEEEHGAD